MDYESNKVVGVGLSKLVLLWIYIKLLDIYQWKSYGKGGAQILVLG